MSFFWSFTISGTQLVINVLAFFLHLNTSANREGNKSLGTIIPPLNIRQKKTKLYSGNRRIKMIPLMELRTP